MLKDNLVISLLQLMLNRKLTSKEAFDAKLVSRIFPDENFHEEVEKALLEALKNASPQSLVASKKLTRSPEFKEQLFRVCRAENEALAGRWLSPDFPEFIMKFLTSKGKL